MKDVGESFSGGGWLFFVCGIGNAALLLLIAGLNRYLMDQNLFGDIGLVTILAQLIFVWLGFILGLACLPVGVICLLFKRWREGLQLLGATAIQISAGLFALHFIFPLAS